MVAQQRPALSLKAVVPAVTMARVPVPQDARPREMLISAAAFLLFTATWLSLLGPVAPLLVMASMMALVCLAPLQVFSGLLRCWPVLIVGLLGMLSSLWSTEPSVTARYGLQLAITLVAAVAFASVLSMRGLLRTIFVSTFVVLLMCILSGRQGGSPQGPVLIGVLGSKNEMGQLCQVAICSSAAMAFSRCEPAWVRVTAVIGAALAALVLAYTFATGAVVTTLVFAIVALTLLVGSRLSGGSKLLLGLVVAAFLVPLWLIRADLETLYAYVVVDVLGKDIGLTGRDYLWAHADRMIADRPLLGYGYRSTWLGTGTETIGLLRWAGLSTGAGFNFHDTFREWAVDFGWSGAGVIALCFGTGMIRLVGGNLGPRATAASLFLAASVFVLIARAKVETVFGPFSSSTVLIGTLSAVGYLWTLGPSEARNPLSPRGRRYARSMEGFTPEFAGALETQRSPEPDARGRVRRTAAATRPL